MSPGSLPYLSIVIPTYNGWPLLESCLRSLEAQVDSDFEIVVVDNGSTDGTVEFLRGNYPAVRVWPFPNNRGFAAAVNAGIRASQGREAVALLNNDTVVHETWTAELRSALQRHPTAAAIASKLLMMNHDHPTINAAGDLYCLDGRSTWRGYGEPDRGQYDHPEWVFGACAAAACYPRWALETVGLFDERLNTYLEDVDWSFRAHLMGYRVLYWPHAVVWHWGGATALATPERRRRTLALVNRNQLWVLAKNLPPTWWRRYGLLIAARQVRLLLSHFKGSLTDLPTVLKAKLDALRRLLLFLRDPKAMTLRNNADIDTLREALCVAWDCSGSLGADGTNLADA